MTLSLRTTPEGPRLVWQPVRELASLREKTFTQGFRELGQGDPNPAASVAGDLVEIDADFAPSPDSEVSFSLRGVPVVYDARSQQLRVGGHRVPAPLKKGRQKMIIFQDRSSIEVFASDGLVYFPFLVLPAVDNHACNVSVRGAPVTFSSLDVYGLKSAWAP